MAKKKRVRHHKHHFHLTAWIIFSAVVLLSILAFYIFQRTGSVKSPSFDDYRVSKNFSGKVVSVDYASDEKAVSFKDKIEEQIKNGVNFAGHYVLAMWDCGQNCKTGAVVDAVSGNIYDLPVSKTCGLEFREDSNLLIIKSAEDCSKDPNSRYFVFEE
jgi:hypothetical protein